MKKRRIRSLTVSEIGMGCMGFSHGYGEIPDETYSIEAIRMAYDYGCTFFDTAEVYSPLFSGLGHNERILGKALKDVRSKVVIATKITLKTDEVRAQGLDAVLLSHLRASLERLLTDYADLYYLHRLNLDIPVEDVAGAMGRLIQKGLVREWGLSQVGVETIAKAQAAAPVGAVQNIYSMVERSCEEDVIPFCAAHGISLVPFSPIASGFLSGKVTAETDFSHADDVRKFVPQLSAENIRANQPLLDVLARFAARKNATMAQISLAWMLHKHQNVIPIPGSKN
ncbi:MAG: aldo/keto reductase, partial [Desulfovibrionaceae bacterium]|nr:aldo/keto reductase [Desulfovibrionaceae bacterium]